MKTIMALGLIIAPWIAQAAPAAQDVYGGGGGNTGVPAFVGPSAAELAAAREAAKSRSAALSARRREHAKMLAEARKKRSSADARTTGAGVTAAKDQSETRAETLVKLGVALEKSNRTGAIDHYFRAIKLAPDGTAGSEAKKHLTTLGVDPELATLPPMEVIRVDAVDTIVVRDVDGAETTVRLIGVAAQSARKPQSNATAEFASAPGMSFITKVSKGQSVVLTYGANDPDLDEAGRTLAYAYRALDGLPINRELIRTGHAHAAAEPDHTQRDDFQKCEAEAKAASRGLWATKPASRSNTPR